MGESVERRSNQRGEIAVDVDPDVVGGGVVQLWILVRVKLHDDTNRESTPHVV